MILLPVGDDNPKVTTPYVHYTIMGVNVVVFFGTLGKTLFEGAEFFQDWGLIPAQFSIVTLFTSMYIHAGIGHIFGNMLFLWVVGDNVEDRLGHFGYFLFYHAAGVAACFAHMIFTDDATMPIVGASGAISGVMGAYAVFFPRAKIKIWYWFFIFFTNIIYVSAKWAVGLWFLQQLLLSAVTRGAGVAYEAHIGGVIFGAAAASILAKAFLKKPDSVRRIVRPRAAAGATQWTTLGGPWEERPPAPQIFDAELATGLQPQVDDTTGLASSLAQGDLGAAYRYFTRATSGYRHVALDEPTIMRLGEALVLAGRYGPAARVYEVMIEVHPESDDAPEAAFRLGTILSRAFRDYARARSCLIQAQQTHRDVQRRSRAQDELRRIDAYLRSTMLSRRVTTKVWIIRQTDEPIDVAGVSELVAARLGGQSAEIAERLVASHGLVACNVPGAGAEALADELQARKIPVLMIPSVDVFLPQSAVRAVSIALSEHGIRFQIAGHTALKTWVEARLISCACIGPKDGGRRVMDFFFGGNELPTHLRVREGEFAFSVGTNSGTRSDFGALATTLAENVTSVAMNPGMYLAESPSDSDDWDVLRFDSERAFDQYNLWFLQLSGAGKMRRGR